MEHGIEGLDRAGSATVRSLAATVDAATGERSVADQEPDDDSSRRPRAHRAALALLTAALVGGAAVWAAGALAPSPTEPSTGPAPIDAAPVPVVAATPDAPVAALVADAGAGAAPSADAAPRGETAGHRAAHRTAARAEHRADQRSVTTSPPAQPSRATDHSVRRSPEPGTVLINTSPWARVTVAGREDGCPDTPCTLKLPPGDYTIELHNPVADLTAEIAVHVDSGATVQRTETLTRRR
jgi:hypothetical protein